MVPPPTELQQEDVEPEQWTTKPTEAQTAPRADSDATSPEGADDADGRGMAAQHEAPVAEGSGADDGNGDDEDPPTSGRRDRRKIQIDLRVLLAVVVVVALGAGAWVLGKRQARGGEQATPTTLPAGFRTFVDAETGVKLSFPRDWEQRSTSDLPEKALRLVAGIPNTGDSVSLRVTPYNSEVTKDNVGDQKNLFDALFAGEDVKVYESKTLTVRELPALFYVYSFTDAATGQVGIHAHFFVFQGRKMVSVILQALPEARYAALAPVFDTIVNSLEVAAGPPPDYGKSVAPVTTGPPGSPSSTVPPTGASTTVAAAPSTSAP